MEIWIVLAAAGSGYLAQYWQSSHELKEALIDIADDDDDDNFESSSRTLPSRRRYHSLSSRRRRMKGGFNHNWHVSKFSQGVGKMTGGCVRNLYVPVGDDKETHEAQAWHNWAIPDICSSNGLTQLETRLDAVCSHSTYAISSSYSPSKCPALSKFNAFWPQKCCGSDFSQRNHDGSGILPEKVASMSPEGLYFAQCTENSTMDKSDFILQEVSPTKCINDVFDNNMVNGTWQDHEGRYSSITRMVRPHQSSGRSRISTKRRRSRAICKPMTSSGNCLSVQSVDYSSHKVADVCTHNSLACGQPFKSLGQNLCKDEGNYLGEENCGLHSSLSKTDSRILNTMRKSESLVERKEMGCDLKRSCHLCCLPFHSSSSGQEEAHRECPAFLGGDNSDLQGSGNNLLKLLLFNLGVGIGMMFAIMLNKHCSNQVFEPLEEALCLLKDLEGEVQGRKKHMFELYNTRDSRENVLVEPSHVAVKILRRIIELVEQVRISFSKDLASVSAVDYRHSKERARLEAELEAELEKMEINLSIGNVSELCQMYSGVCEDDLEIGKLVQGELSTTGIPCDVESDLDDSDSSHEVIHFGNCAVPPVELAGRLHEVLEARQDKQILDLEAELKQLDSRLQAKENEFQVWKQRAWHLLQDSALESLSESVCVKAEDITTKVPSSSIQEEHSFSAGMGHSAIISPVSVECEGPFSSNDTKEASSLHQRGLQPRTWLGDETYDEVCEEFLLWSDTASETPSRSSTGLVKGAHPELEQVSVTHNATNDTLASTPCSLKVTDKCTVAHRHLEDKLKCKAEMDASSRENHSDLVCKGHMNVDRNGEVLHHPNGTSLSQQPVICAQDVIDIYESRGQFGCVLDWSMSEYSSYSSELDEHFGQLLIKRIVEKSKQGSSIVEVAQSVMASLDIDENDLEMEYSGG